jgi:ABC-type multidrug transport system ATPase subunit
MEISLEAVGKKYNRNWIFRGIDFTFDAGGSYALLGGNGSGKSTLLQLLAAYQGASSGKITWQKQGKRMEPGQLFQHLTLAAPYLELPEELTLSEILHFHAQFKKPLLPFKDIARHLGLEKETDKQVRHFSSGMKGKLKLGLALYFESSIIFLDEPCTNLDFRATAWYQQELAAYKGDRLLIVASNDPREYELCESRLEVEAFKGKR